MNDSKGKKHVDAWLGRVTYDEDIVKLQNKITSEVAKEFLGFAKEVTEWCTLKIKLIEL